MRNSENLFMFPLITFWCTLEYHAMYGKERASRGNFNLAVINRCPLFFRATTRIYRTTAGLKYRCYLTNKFLPVLASEDTLRRAAAILLSKSADDLVDLMDGQP